MRKIKLTIAYDGTGYSGFQKQCGCGLRTIQGELETALAVLAKGPVPIVAAGRTDAGVHARGQVVHFQTGAWTIPTEKIVMALNARLSGEIVAVKAEEAGAEFHARYDAVDKTYVYSILNRETPSPFRRLYSYHFPWPLDVGAMRRAAAYLVGRHDFTAFRSGGRPVKSAVRTLFHVQVATDGPMVLISFRGSGFLYQMARVMASVLIEAGRGRMEPGAVPGLIASRDRSHTGKPAPPHGLRLEEVRYSKNNVDSDKG